LFVKKKSVLGGKQHIDLFAYVCWVWRF